jgi:hypothetical protein
MKRTKELILQDSPEERLLRKLELPADDVHAEGYTHEGYVHLLGRDEHAPVGLIRPDADINWAIPGKWTLQDAMYGFVDDYGSRAYDRIVRQIFRDLNRGVYKGVAKFTTRDGKRMEQPWELEPDEGREERRAESEKLIAKLMGERQ